MFNDEDTKTGKRGRPRISTEQRLARVLNRMAFERIANMYLHLTKSEVKAKLDDPSTPVIELLVASVLVSATKKGDHHKLNFILDRLIGKVVERVEIVEQREEYNPPESMSDEAPETDRGEEGSDSQQVPADG